MDRFIVLKQLNARTDRGISLAILLLVNFPRWRFPSGACFSKRIGKEKAGASAFLTGSALIAERVFCSWVGTSGFSGFFLRRCLDWLLRVSHPFDTLWAICFG